MNSIVLSEGFWQYSLALLVLFVFQYGLVTANAIRLIAGNSIVLVPAAPLAGHFYLFGNYLYGRIAPLHRILINPKSIGRHHELTESDVSKFILSNGFAPEIAAIHLLPLAAILNALYYPHIWLFGNKFGAYLSMFMLLSLVFHGTFSLILFLFCMAKSALAKQRSNSGCP